MVVFEQLGCWIVMESIEKWPSKKAELSEWRVDVELEQSDALLEKKVTISNT